MIGSRQYDTVAFDVRDNATMLFFAKTTDTGDILDYLLLMRTVEEDFDESIYIEVNEQQFGGHNLISEASLTGNVLTLRLHEAAEQLGGATEIVLTWSETTENLDSIEAGVFRVLGDTLTGGHA
ncbi:MAG: hypothetical protein KJP08_02010 [Gammaproteobacteria bacterium]|nr:hypothetical protein [Gammaproteobacteria bacterium]MBT8106477.1 hypothetical protein [Gammaproteobacteria bacterium]NNF49368.1 hypothetical protein [Woeseiaceae bacterium]NNK26492.1 hypothetical protein [Woeseiaceae bacterium]NNL62594.1 hypothetical protein [Woeseiaceae bacterium]